MQARTPARKLNAALAAALASLAAALGCSSVERKGVEGEEGDSVSPQVEALSIPLDSDLPRFVVAVEPFHYGASAAGSGAEMGLGLDGGSWGGAPSQAAVMAMFANAGGAAPEPGPQVGKGIAAQVTSALTRGGNIAVVDSAAVARGADGTFACRMEEGEVGPFILRGTVTEFSETSDFSGGSRGGSLTGITQAAMGVGSMVPGVGMAVSVAGMGLSAANPSFEQQASTRKGTVAMEVQLVDGRTARIVSSYRAAGVFTTTAEASGFSLFGIGGSDSEMAASAIGQATRAAANDVLRKTMEALVLVARPR